ncbi:MAG: HesA/MoeB/ThiF family protein [Alphaproteobacteria bacterium]
MDFTDDQVERYSRHIILREVGGAGQQKLLHARVLVVGAGGLGSPLLMYLAAAGIGTIGIVDDDIVALSNLQRQIAHGTGDVDQPKIQSAANTINDLNPDVTVEAHNERLTAGNAVDLISRYDVVADGTDNFETRFLVNDACYFAQVPLVSAAIGQFEGQLATYRAFDGEAPCYRCIFPEAPPPGTVPSCAEAGVIGALGGVMGSLQAMEVIKQVLDLGDSMAGRLLIYDALATRFRTVKVPRDPKCALCGSQSTIHDLSQHAA